MQMLARIPRNYLVVALIFSAMGTLDFFVKWILPMLGWSISDSGYGAARGLLVLAGAIVIGVTWRTSPKS